MFLITHLFKKFELIKVYGKGINIKKLAKKHLFWVGVIISTLAIFFYSQTITNVQIIGLKRIDESTVYQAVLSEIKPPVYVTKNLMNKIEKTVMNIDGISYVSAKKEGRTLKVNIVEELSKIDKLDTQNLISVKASEEGMITKIVVYGGTCLVKVGDKVSKGQELIAPYHLNADGDRKPTLAFGKIEAKITKEIQLTYSNEKEYNERFLQEYDEQTRLVKLIIFLSQRKLLDINIVAESEPDAFEISGNLFLYFEKRDGSAPRNL